MTNDWVRRSPKFAKTQHSEFFHLDMYAWDMYLVTHRTVCLHEGSRTAAHLAQHGRGRSCARLRVTYHFYAFQVHIGHRARPTGLSLCACPEALLLQLWMVVAEAAQDCD